jgi:preprotein translocase subunit SecF
MQLVEQGKLSLDEPIGKLLPDLASPQVLEGFDGAGEPILRPAKRPITLRHLMTHTAGFCYDMWNADMGRYMEKTVTPGIISCTNAALKTPLASDPGTRWEYGINIDFVGKRYFFVALSTLINLAALVCLFTIGFDYGVDFRGGSVLQVKFDHPTTAGQIREALAPLNFGDVTVQDFGNRDLNQYLLGFEQIRNIGSVGASIKNAVDESYSGANKVEVLRVETVGAKVGSDLRRRGFLAVGLATLLMGVYIAFQFRNVSWSFGAGAVIALIHDVLVVSLALIISHLEFDLTTLAALLTVIGYSVHDTIIVSDRIREDSAKRRREPLAAIMNRAINETLSRTVLTSGTVLVVLASLLALGGPILRPAAFTLFVGIITGTYSSIYIAGPVVLFWERGQGARRTSARAA